MRTERNKWEIIIAVFEVIRAEEKAKKTRIMHMAYLDWRNFKRHFNFLYWFLLFLSLPNRVLKSTVH
jgi:predicted transcriptional regulator